MGFPTAFPTPSVVESLLRTNSVGLNSTASALGSGGSTLESIAGLPPPSPNSNSGAGSTFGSRSPPPPPKQPHRFHLLDSLLERHASQYDNLRGIFVRCSLWYLKALGKLAANGSNNPQRIEYWRDAVRLVSDMQAAALDPSSNVPYPNEALHSTAMQVCSNANRPKAALSLLARMKEQVELDRCSIAVPPDAFCYNVAIAACRKLPSNNPANPGAGWRTAVGLLVELRLRGLRATTSTYSATISACAEAGKAHQALTLLNELKSDGTSDGDTPGHGLQPDRITYNACLSALNKACTLGGQFPTQKAHLAALRLLQEMQVRFQIEPDARTYAAAISACSHDTAGHGWKSALSLLEEMRAKNLFIDNFSYNAALSCLDRGGQWETALRVLGEMKENGRRARAQQQQSLASASDEVDSDDPRVNFQKVEKPVGGAPDAISYACVLGALKQAGRFREAHEMLAGMESDLAFHEEEQRRAAEAQEHAAPGEVPVPPGGLRKKAPPPITPSVTCYRIVIHACAKRDQWHLVSDVLARLDRKMRRLLGGPGAGAGGGGSSSQNGGGTSRKSRDELCAAAEVLGNFGVIAGVVPILAGRSPAVIGGLSAEQGVQLWWSLFKGRAAQAFIERHSPKRGPTLSQDEVLLSEVPITQFAALKKRRETELYRELDRTLAAAVLSQEDSSGNGAGLSAVRCIDLLNTVAFVKEDVGVQEEAVRAEEVAERDGGVDGLSGNGAYWCERYLGSEEAGEPPQKEDRTETVVDHDPDSRREQLRTLRDQLTQLEERGQEGLKPVRVALLRVRNLEAEPATTTEIRLKRPATQKPAPSGAKAAGKFGAAAVAYESTISMPGSVFSSSDGHPFGCADHTHSTNPAAPKRSGLERALQALQKVVHREKLSGFGSYATRDVLDELGLKEPDVEFMERARAAVGERVAERTAGGGPSSQSVDGESAAETPGPAESDTHDVLSVFSARIAIPRDNSGTSSNGTPGAIVPPPNSSDILAYCDYEVRIRHAPTEPIPDSALNTVKVACAGQVADSDGAEKGEDSDVHQPFRIINCQHHRGQHAEAIVAAKFAQALKEAQSRRPPENLAGVHHLHHQLPVDVTSSDLSMSSDGSEETLVTGRLRLYASHPPCVSCVSVLSQLARKFRGVRIEVGYEPGCG